MAIEYGNNEEQDMLRTMARDFLANECPMTRVRELMADETGFDRELWKKMAELGWLGLIFPEEYGGAGMTFRDLTILLEEMGRMVLPSPFISTLLLVGLPVLTFGTKEQKDELLPKIANGEAVCTLAALEEDGDWWADSVNVRADRRGDQYVINGTKLFVPDAKVADYMLIAARTKRTEDPEDGITLFLLDTRDVWGTLSTTLRTMDETRKQHEVVFANVPVPASSILGELHQGWPIMKHIALHATAALCAEMVGAGEKVLEMTVGYLKERVAFGVVIGSFQALQHRAADMAIGLEYARSLMEWAAEAIKEDNPDATTAVSMAKSFCGDTCKKVVAEGIQMHGGIGFTWDHDMHLYFKRVWASDNAFGDGNYHRELVAKALDDIHQLAGNGRWIKMPGRMGPMG
jgi:alkylation response protein AidB-like acyl-CoA dehydrogenase